MKAIALKRNLFIYTFSLPQFAHASVDSSLKGIQVALATRFLPTLAGISLAFCAGAFLLGSPNAKQYLQHSILGCIIIYAIQSIVSFIAGTVN